MYRCDLHVCVRVCALMFVHVFAQNAGLNASPFIDVYDGLLIKFMAPLELQDEFLVPEAVAAAGDLTAAAAGDGGGDN